MDLAEAIVERFVTANAFAGEGVAFVCPQFRLRDNDDPSWSADLDFVVLHFLPGDKSRVILIEVCDSGSLGSVGTKAKHFEGRQYRERLAYQVAELTNGLTRDWPVEFLGFVRTDDLARDARRKYPGAFMNFRSLDEAFRDGWWERRALGLFA